MSWGFRPALPLTGGSDPGGYVRGFMSANLLEQSSTYMIINVKSVSLNNNFKMNKVITRYNEKVVKESRTSVGATDAASATVLFSVVKLGPDSQNFRRIS